MQDLIHTIMIIFAFGLPLFAWLVVLVLVVAIVVFAVKVARKRGVHSRGWLLAFSLILVLLTGDEIVGRSYFHHLCATQEGFKLYRSIRLPAEYWRGDGTPVFMNARGQKIASKLDEGYATSFVKAGSPAPALRIDRQQLRISVRATGQLLGTYTWFQHEGGWLNRYVGSTQKFDHCFDEIRAFEKLLKIVFVD